MEVKNDDIVIKMCLKNKCVFPELFALIRARAGPIWVYTGPYGPEISQKIRKKFALPGAVKGPVALP